MKIFFIFIIFFLFPSSVFASKDITITCSNSTCAKSTESLFFSENNIFPGYIKSQNIRVINNRSDSCYLNFNLKTTLISDYSLSLVQMLSLSSDDKVWYSGTINNLLDNNNHELGYIDSNQYKDFRWTFSLDKALGNEYQKLNNSFNLNLNFTCHENSNSSDLLCHDISPIKSPQNLKVIAKQNSVTLFWNEPDDNYTYYLISYSTNESASSYGNPNISKGTNSYTIDNLSGNTTYFFKIRTGNGCAPGPFSNIVSVTFGGQALSKTFVPTGFYPDVLGDQASTFPESTCISIFPFAFSLAFLINIILHRYRFFTFFISLLSFVFDYYLSNFTCTKHPHFYFLNAVSFLLPLIFSFKTLRWRCKQFFLRNLRLPEK